MKKIFKVIAAVAVSGACIAGAAALSGCYKTSGYNGEYSYYVSKWYTTYGTKVRVEVQSDGKGDRIRNVEIIDSVYTEATNSNPAYGWDNGVGCEELLVSYRGRYIADVLSTPVTLTKEQTEAGCPVGVGDDGLIVSGATQCSGRLLLAVQDALLDAADALGYNVVEGEYSYPNPWTPTVSYGIRVRVIVKDGVIKGVVNIPSSYIECTENWKNNKIWYAGLNDLLASYKTRTVDEVLGKTVSTDGNGQPNGTMDAEYMITGATQGSGRLLLAVQDAVKKLKK